MKKRKRKAIEESSRNNSGNNIHAIVKDIKEKEKKFKFFSPPFFIMSITPDEVLKFTEPTKSMHQHTTALQYTLCDDNGDE